MPDVPDVALFEAANRIMTDLVILYGVRWLLKDTGCSRLSDTPLSMATRTMNTTTSSPKRKAGF